MSVDSSNNSHHVYAFPRNEGEEIRFTLRTYNDKLYVDFRLWYQDQEAQEYKPTRKGLSVLPERLPEIQEGIDHLREALNKLQTPETRSLPKAPQGFQKRRDSRSWVNPKTTGEHRL